MRRVQLYDTTLRDGTQAEDISFPLEDKIRIAEALSDAGVHRIEACLVRREVSANPKEPAPEQVDE